MPSKLSSSCRRVMAFAHHWTLPLFVFYRTTPNVDQMDDTHVNITYTNFTKVPRETNGDWFMDTYQ
jgi:hypothetical protein